MDGGNSNPNNSDGSIQDVPQVLLSTPPVPKRKRGLSLRSQLFNKAFAGTSAVESDPVGLLVTPELLDAHPDSDSQELPVSYQPFEGKPIELQDLAVPSINVVPAESTTIGHLSHEGNAPASSSSLSANKYVPYNSGNRSTTHLTDDTDVYRTYSSDAEDIHFDQPKKRRTGIIVSLRRFKNKVMGIKNLPPTKDGRKIPLEATNHLLSMFLSPYYDPYYKKLIDERSDEPYCNNVITLAKYNVYTFFPKQLKAQFSKLANCYFMVVAIMQMIPTWSTTGQFTTIIPLLIFMSISIAREGFDDWKRHLHDKEENNKPCTTIVEVKADDQSDTRSVITETLEVNNSVLNIGKDEIESNKKNLKSELYTNRKLMHSYNLQEHPTKWKRLKVGDIVKVHENEWIPADLVLLATSNSLQDAYVETIALDGELNLKLKNPHVELSKQFSTVVGLKHLRALVTVEDPNTDLYNFEGQFSLADDIRSKFSLGPDNVVYRGSVVRNTKSILGLVIFTGEETKIRMNNIKNPRVKAPKLQKNINYIVLFMVCIVILLSALSTMAERLYYNRDRLKNWYLMDEDAGVAATLMGFIIMYNTLIPLSLYVTMEIIKVMQLVFLQNDIDMYHSESDTPADAKTATILEELGQVGYIFSDKTGTLTDNKMIFRKFSVCGISCVHDLDLESAGAHGIGVGNTNVNARNSTNKPVSLPRRSTATVARTSMELTAIESNTSWKSTAQPNANQDMVRSLELLKYIQSHPHTLFSKKAKFFLLSIALCNSCLPKRANAKGDDDEDDDIRDSRDSSVVSLQIDEFTNDEDIDYQASSPDELALVQAARDLGFVVFDRKQKILSIKTYPKGFENEYIIEEYQVLDVIEFSSARKRMSIVVKFPDGRICLICKGADNIILELLKNKVLALGKAKEINESSKDRKMMEADIVLQTRFSQDSLSGGAGGENSPRASLSSLRRSLSVDRDPVDRMNSIDNYLMNNEGEQLDNIVASSRRSLQLQQSQKYNLGNGSSSGKSGSADSVEQKIKRFIPNDKLLIDEEFIIEKTLQHIEEFSTEGLRTLLYSFKWIDKSVYEKWSMEYHEAKIALTNRNALVEEVGSVLEADLELLGASAIEDKLQDGVPDTIDKLRRAGIKVWMLTGDKRETALNIGYSCRLIKDYSTVVILSLDESKEELVQKITSANTDLKGGRVAHSVVVIDGATLAEIEKDSYIMPMFIEFCCEVDSAVVCRASPSQKATMVTSIRTLKSECVTLAIGDGANDIAMIQSADIGVGITGKEGLQAARSSDYAIAQFRFLLKLLLVNGRYNYIRTSKFVLCTFYKELMFYLTQAVFQRFDLFSGSSMYEPWSLSMFNTLFTSLPVICVGMFDRDLRASTLIAIPELYNKGRLYKAFNLRIFVTWMLLATSQSLFISFVSSEVWSLYALKDNTIFPVGTLLFAAMVIVINTKCEILEMQNRQWLAFAAFIISVGGYALWNVLIMFMYRSKESPIFFVNYGLLTWGQDQSWWASLLVLFTVPILFDILLKVFKFMLNPSDDELFKLFEQDIEMRILFEEKSWNELYQGWTMDRDQSTTKLGIKKIFHKIGILKNDPVALAQEATAKSNIDADISYQQTVIQRKRAGTVYNPYELAPGRDGISLKNLGVEETLPSGKKVKRNRGRKNSWWKREEEEENIEDILERRGREVV